MNIKYEFMAPFFHYLYNLLNKNGAKDDKIQTSLWPGHQNKIKGDHQLINFILIISCINIKGPKLLAHQNNFGGGWQVTY